MSVTKSNSDVEKAEIIYVDLLSNVLCFAKLICVCHAVFELRSLCLATHLLLQILADVWRLLH